MVGVAVFHSIAAVSFLFLARSRIFEKYPDAALGRMSALCLAFLSGALAVYGYLPGDVRDADGVRTAAYLIVGFAAMACCMTIGVYLMKVAPALPTPNPSSTSATERDWVELRHGELSVLKSPGGLKAHGLLTTVFGHAKLTNQRLLFKRAEVPILSPLDLFPKYWQLRLSSIQEVRPGSLYQRIVSGGRRSMRILTKEGRSYTLMITRDMDSWLQKLESIASQ